MKKSASPAASQSGIKKQESGPVALKFSFKLFDATDGEACPANFADGYVHALMDRLKALSTWTVTQFLTPQGKAVRNHPIDWGGTARPNGFAHLNEQLRAYTAHQFSISANERGRVHGLLIDDTFHIIWLDQNHVVYP